MNGRTEEKVLGDIARMVRDVISEEWVADVDIGMETSFAKDLELESIEFVALAEKLRERYGDRIDFVAFVGELDVEEIVSMTVGRLVTHIHQCINESGGENDG